MSDVPHAGESAPTARTDCWNGPGVLGESTCPELATHIHCRNCPTYSAAAAGFLDAEVPDNYLQQCTAQVARGKPLAEVDPVSVVVFRVGDEWFGLPTAVLEEIVGVRPVHSVPHRRNGVLLGLTNIRGELLPCFSLQQVLGLDMAAPAAAGSDVRGRDIGGRLLVVRRDGGRAVCPVTEVHGIVHFFAQDMTPVPATIAGATTAYTRSALRWQEKLVGLLDDERLLETVNRSLA